MIACPSSTSSLPVPVVGGRAARIAVVGRRKAGVRRRYRPLAGVCAWIASLTTVVIVYLLLMANVTRTGYDLSRANRERVALQDQTMRLDNELARLKSRDRLADIAARLGMQDSGTYVVVQMPQPQPHQEHHGLAFLTAISGWIR